MKDYIQMTNDVFSKIEEQKAAAKKRNLKLKKAGAAAGCLCAAAVIAVAVFASPRSDPGANVSTENVSGTVSASSNDLTTTTQSSNPHSVSGSDNTEVSSPGGPETSSPGGPDVSSPGTSTQPPDNRPEELPQHTADRLPLVVHDGRLYIYSAEYTGERNQEIKKLFETCLGRTTGNTDDDMTEAELVRCENLTSDLRGEVYTLKGYPESFRLCVVLDGQDRTIILEALVNAGIVKGSQLFEDMLGLSNKAGVFCWEGGDISDVKPADDDFERFMDALNEGRFESIEEICPDLYKRSDATIYMKLEDGTFFRLRLYAGGYVVYPVAGLSQYVIKLSPDVFDPVFNALQ